uniref:Uncharacterized protein n=1 Tax=Anguilla anguilla TaxID=7936 RepID=A0A0E9PYX0_ANGAN
MNISEVFSNSKLD